MAFQDSWGGGEGHRNLKRSHSIRIPLNNIFSNNNEGFIGREREDHRIVPSPGPFPRCCCKSGDLRQLWSGVMTGLDFIVSMMPIGVDKIGDVTGKSTATPFLCSS